MIVQANKRVVSPVGNPIVRAFAAPSTAVMFPLVGSVAIAPSATVSNYRSFPVNARGFIIQQLTLGGTNPNLFTIGINKGSPFTMVVRDAFHSDELLITSIEIYNSSLTTTLDVIGVAFRGVYAPSANSISTVSGIGNGLFTPLATSVATLTALATTGLTAGTIIEYYDSTTLALVSWVLVTDAGSPVTGAGITVPNDYNASSNPKVWHQI